MSIQGKNYINRIISELLDKDSPSVMSDLEHASNLLDEISTLQSPQKEEVFVRLVMERAFEVKAQVQRPRLYAA